MNIYYTKEELQFFIVVGQVSGFLAATVFWLVLFPILKWLWKTLRTNRKGPHD